MNENQKALLKKHYRDMHRNVMDWSEAVTIFVLAPMVVFLILCTTVAFSMDNQDKFFPKVIIFIISTVFCGTLINALRHMLVNIARSSIDCAIWSSSLEETDKIELVTSKSFWT